MVLVVCSCGYQLRGRGLPYAKRPTVYVEVFTTTYRDPWWGFTVSQSIRRRLEESHYFRLVTSPKAADYVISGRLEEVRADPTSFASHRVTLQRRLRVRVSLGVRDGSGRWVFRQKGVWEEVYPVVEVDTGDTDPERALAFERLCERLAEDFFEALLFLVETDAKE